MNARRYTEDQMITVLKDGEAVAKAANLCRKHGMSDVS